MQDGEDCQIQCCAAALGATSQLGPGQPGPRIRGGRPDQNGVHQKPHPWQQPLCPCAHESQALLVICQSLVLKFSLRTERNTERNSRFRICRLAVPLGPRTSRSACASQAAAQSGGKVTAIHVSRGRSEACSRGACSHVTRLRPCVESSCRRPGRPLAHHRRRSSYPPTTPRGGCPSSPGRTTASRVATRLRWQDASALRVAPVWELERRSSARCIDHVADSGGRCTTHRLTRDC